MSISSILKSRDSSRPIASDSDTQAIAETSVRVGNQELSARVEEFRSFPGAIYALALFRLKLPEVSSSDESKREFFMEMAKRMQKVSHIRHSEKISRDEIDTAPNFLARITYLGSLTPSPEDLSILDSPSHVTNFFKRAYIECLTKVFSWYAPSVFDCPKERDRLYSRLAHAESLEGAEKVLSDEEKVENNKVFVIVQATDRLIHDFLTNEDSFSRIPVFKKPRPDSYENWFMHDVACWDDK